LEFIHFRKEKNKVQIISNVFKESENLKIPIYAIQQVITEKKIKKFVIYENLLLDIEKYIEEHPGGRNILSNNLYQDISRYITGNQAFSTKISAYNHNVETHIFSIKNISYAMIKDQHKIILNMNGNSTYINNPMNFLNKITFADSTGKISFEKNGFIFANFIKGFQWCGRHFSISSITLNKIRYYSICICLNELPQKKFRQLLNNLILLEENNKIEDIKIEENERYTNQISFYIKSYNYPKALSQHINSISKNNISKNENQNENYYNNEFIIRGPIVIYPFLMYLFLNFLLL
jgi:hypothetical protein